MVDSSSPLASGSAQAASQPMSNEDGSLWFLSTEKFTNHAENPQRAGVTRGHRWKTDHSDTKSFPCFRSMGIECRRSSGEMFAIAIWAAASFISGCRDRIGSSRYYSVHHQRLYSLGKSSPFAGPGTAPGGNEEGLYHYLSFLTTPARTRCLQEFTSCLRTWLRVRQTASTQQARYGSLDHGSRNQPVGTRDCGRTAG